MHFGSGLAEGLDVETVSLQRLELGGRICWQSVACVSDGAEFAVRSCFTTSAGR